MAWAVAQVFSTREEIAETFASHNDMATFHRMLVHEGRIPADIIEFLKAMKERPDASILQILQRINSKSLTKSDPYNLSAYMD